MNLTEGLNALQECVKPVVATMPDTKHQILVRRVLGDDGLVRTLVDVRQHEQGVWTPIQLCGGSFEVRDE